MYRMNKLDTYKAELSSKKVIISNEPFCLRGELWCKNSNKKELYLLLFNSKNKIGCEVPFFSFRVQAEGILKLDEDFLSLCGVYFSNGVVAAASRSPTTFKRVGRDSSLFLELIIF